MVSGMQSAYAMTLEIDAPPIVIENEKLQLTVAKISIGSIVQPFENPGGNDHRGVRARAGLYRSFHSHFDRPLESCKYQTHIRPLEVPHQQSGYAPMASLKTSP